ncbi:electron transport complex subunit E [Kangiella geojedonensis]|uniref:Ion-translocating oxidoreductase complex subunit E n=1 Tax=Kangiella geojedonensis TaxID=914150 RepID=A0A0F6TQR8_9GAMM|nr:electron transport complex subunit E [Kangiella geojedonensis]AKE52329.1 Electron transport complex subunit E [Kangiella geojedonensis]
MSDIDNKTIIKNGLWDNNPALVQLLGLCPLLAVSNTFINGLGLGLATLLVLAGSNASVSLVRHYIPKDIRIPIFVMMIASFVTNIGLLMNAYTYDLYLTLGIFIPLIVTNCAIIGRAEAFASKNSFFPSLLDGIMQGLGFTAVLCTLGGLREMIGQGTLFSGAEQLLGSWASHLEISFYLTDAKFLFAILPPGAFVALGILIAIKNIIDSRAAEKAKQRTNNQNISGDIITNE